MVTKQGVVWTPADRQRRDKVTLKEVAAHAGVSPSVASTILSGGSNTIRVAVETHARVVEAARALGYRSRRTGTTAAPAGHRSEGAETADGTDSRLLEAITVGIITSFNPQSTQDSPGGSYDPWEHEISGGFEIALNAGAAQVVTHYCNRGRRGHLPLPFDEALAQVMAPGVDALALIEISSSPQDVGTCAPLLMASGRPFVIISTDSLSAPVANVFFDNINAGYQATQHLIEQGYCEICFLAPVRAPWADERIAGAREALRYAGIPAENLRVFPAEADRPELPSFDARVSQWDHTTSGREAGARLLEREHGAPPRAVIAINDPTAVGFLLAAERWGLSPGVDYALVGFDDAPLARQHGLTSVRPPREAMGREAARLLLRLAKGEEAARVQTRLNSHLMTRRSTPPCHTLSPSKEC